MTVELWYREGLGNNLFQYVFARLLAEDLGRELVCRSRLGASLSRFDPIWVDLGELPSLHHIARFDRIVLSNSTFAWWAAFLSDASRIWMPRPCTGYWSAETTRIALAMDDPRYVLVDDVEVELWRPWSPRPALRSATLTEGAEGAVMRVEGGAAPSEIHLHPASVPLARWLIARACPFGPVDVRHLLSPGELRASLPLLFALTRAGALEADPEELALASSLLG